MRMTEELYQKLSAEFDRLDEVHGPLELDENMRPQEDRRLRYRAAWLAFLETQGVTDEEWDIELERRLNEKFGGEHGTHQD